MSRSRGGLLGVIGAVVACAIVGAILAFAHGDSSGATPTSSAPAAKPSSSPEKTAADVRWIELAGVSLPVSTIDGPQDLSDGLARGFSDSPAGAALAAVHLVVRTSPSVGTAITEGTLHEQVVGPNQPALTRSVASARPIEQTPATATISGYLPVYFEGGRAASVDLVIGSPELALRRQYLSVRISLQWSDDDWRLIAPPQGDWATVTSVIDTLPVGMHTYGG